MKQTPSANNNTEYDEDNEKNMYIWMLLVCASSWEKWNYGGEYERMSFVSQQMQCDKITQDISINDLTPSYYLYNFPRKS